MTAKLPEEERLARARLRRQVWWEKNPDYRELNREPLAERRRAREWAKQKLARDERERAASDADQRKRAAERAAEWAKNNPTKRQEARDRYKAQNPDKYRASQREYYYRNKQAIKARRQTREAADPEKLRAQRRAASLHRKEPATKWAPSEEQREKYRAANRDKKRLERRLHEAGLPPRRLRRTLVSERRANLAAAEKFFSRPRSRAEIRRISSQDAATPGILLEEWARYSALVRRRNQMLTATQTYIDRHRGDLRDEVEFDSRVRESFGKRPLAIEEEVRRRAQEVVRRAYEGMAPLTVAYPSAPAAARVEAYVPLRRHGRDAQR